jgi:putative ABC transport system permease protein
MFRNHVITAIRNLRRDGYYSVIKITGLALGFATSMVLLLYVFYQLSFDTQHPDADRTYRVNQTNIWDPAGGVFSSTGVAVAMALKSDYEEIEDIVRVNTPGSATVRYAHNDGQVTAINENRILAADSNFFSFFAFPLREGDPRTCLIGKDKVVLSEEAARRLFGEEAALGKQILMGDQRTVLEVTGVTAKQPRNVHFNFDYLLSMETNPAMKQFEWSWVYTQVVTYLKVRPDADVAALAEKIKNAPDKHARATFQRIRMDFDEFKRERGNWQLFLQPVREIHLRSVRMGNRLGPVGNYQNVVILGVIGIFILLIAVINFVNLSTARAANRAKEVGVKKSMGWSKRSLIIQFQIEHMVMTGISLVLGLGMMELLRLAIAPLTGIEIPLQVLYHPGIMITVLGLPLIIGFLAGLYPSFFLTSFRPAQVLKGRLATGFRSSGLRNTLVVFQFAISLSLMAATIIIFDQLRFFQSKDVGFEKENLLVINHVEKLGEQLESLRNEVAAYTGVRDVSVSTDIRNSFEDLFVREGDARQMPVALYKVDEHFVDVTGITVKAGRAFDEREADKQHVMINETTASLFGLTPEDAVGAKISYVGDEVGPAEVIGVVKDFHFQSLRQNIAPLIFYSIHSTIWGDNRVLLVKYNGDPAMLVNKIQQRWNDLTDATPFEYSYYDDEVKSQYDDEAKLLSLFSVFTGLSISIAVVGLVGLAAYSASQRRKEIGIRKVFGASVAGIYLMLNGHYMKLMVIALAVAAPATWWLMQQWLEMYTYRISIDPLIFVKAGLMEFAFALLCVGSMVIRAAALNPSDALKEE